MRQLIAFFLLLSVCACSTHPQGNPYLKEGATSFTAHEHSLEAGNSTSRGVQPEEIGLDSKEGESGDTGKEDSVLCIIGKGVVAGVSLIGALGLVILRYVPLGVL